MVWESVLPTAESVEIQLSRGRFIAVPSGIVRNQFELDWKDLEWLFPHIESTEKLNQQLECLFSPNTDSLGIQMGISMDLSIVPPGIIWNQFKPE